MPNGFGQGRGFGRSFRGGMGFGFRGASPPWPYVGLGRGGLPRCGYFLSGAAGIAPLGVAYQQPAYPFSTGMPSAAQVSTEQELAFLREQAQSIRQRVEEIQARLQKMGTEKNKEGL